MLSFDPGSLNLSQLTSYVRDLSVIGTVGTFAWKASGIVRAVSDFCLRITNFMDRVEHSMCNLERDMNVVLNNHASHIERDLHILAEAQIKKDAEIK